LSEGVELKAETANAKEMSEISKNPTEIKKRINSELFILIATRGFIYKREIKNGSKKQINKNI